MIRTNHCSYIRTARGGSHNGDDDLASCNALFSTTKALRCCSMVARSRFSACASCSSIARARASAMRFCRSSLSTFARCASSASRSCFSCQCVSADTARYHVQPSAAASSIWPSHAESALERASELLLQPLPSVGLGLSFR